MVQTVVFVVAVLSRLQSCEKVSDCRFGVILWKTKHIFYCFDRNEEGGDNQMHLITCSSASLTASMQADVLAVIWFVF